MAIYLWQVFDSSFGLLKTKNNLDFGLT